MKEVITVEVREGDTLQLHFAEGPVGDSITIPTGVSSVTVIIRDTAGLEEQRNQRAERRAARSAAQANRGGERGTDRRGRKDEEGINE